MRDVLLKLLLEHGDRGFIGVRQRGGLGLLWNAGLISIDREAVPPATFEISPMTFKISPKGLEYLKNIDNP